MKLNVLSLLSFVAGKTTKASSKLKTSNEVKLKALVGLLSFVVRRKTMKAFLKLKSSNEVKLKEFGLLSFMVKKVLPLPFQEIFKKAKR